jgi:histidinol dehydrogenase
MMATHPISRLDMSEPDFEAAFGRLLISPAEADADLAQTVTQIVAAVAREGDAALVRYTNELDRRTVEDAQALRVRLLETISSASSSDARRVHVRG